MIKNSYRFHWLLYENFPHLNRGLGFFYFPITIIFFLISIVFFPLYRVKNKILFRSKVFHNKPLIQFVFTYNQLKSSQAINIENSLLIDFTSSDVSNKYIISINNKKIGLILLFNSWSVFKNLLIIYKDVKIRKDVIRCFKLIAISEVAKFYFKKRKVLIQYNDHSPYNVLLFDIAKQSDLKTVYIQHAPVSNDFPSLYHDLNLLFSRDSVAKYKFTSGDYFNKVKSLELFDLRFPNLDDLPQKKPKYALICFNNLDNIEKVKSCALFFVKHGYKVVLRPHPADKRNFRFENITISSNKSIWEDLKYAIFVIVNESAVPLESLYYNIPTYKLSSFSEISNDNYGFLKEGVLYKNYKNEEEIYADITQNKIMWDISKISYFLGDLNNRENKLNEFNIELNKFLQD